MQFADTAFLKSSMHRTQPTEVPGETSRAVSVSLANRTSCANISSSSQSPLSSLAPRRANERAMDAPRYRRKTAMAKRQTVLSLSHSVCCRADATALILQS